jgi:rhamnogalacturonan acetylesterase
MSARRSLFLALALLAAAGCASAPKPKSAPPLASAGPSVGVKPNPAPAALTLAVPTPALVSGLTNNLPARASATALARPSLFIVGDSTAANGADLGWGSHLGKYFDAAKLNVFNRARGGRSSRTFQLEGLWDKVLGEIKAGDFVLIQLGRNDGGSPTGRPGRGSLKGLGEETQVITNSLNQTETVHTFGWYMRKYVADTKARGATPIILSLTVRNEWRDGKVERGPGQLSKWSEDVAKSEGVLFVDLNNIVGALYEKLGQEKVKEFFPIDHTHTSAEGANLNAKSVVSGLKGLKEHPLDGCLSDEGKAVDPYTPEPAK